MGKKNKDIVEYDTELDEFGFDAFDDELDELSMSDLMTGFIEAKKEKIKLALELTKLVVTTDSSKKTEEHVFSAYNKALEVIEDSFGFEEMFKAMQQNED